MVLGVSALLVTGCGEGGPALVEIEGTVTNNGKPLSGANVAIAFDGGVQSLGFSGADGKFTVMTNGRPGAPIGQGKVSISKPSSASSSGGAATMTAEDMAKMAREQMAGGMAALPKPEVAEKYSNPATSGLVVDVVAGGKEKNSFTLALTD